MTDRLLPWVADWWKPIETAPRDGTDILVAMWDSHTMLVVSYDPEGTKTTEFPWLTPDGANSYHKDAPTHWMPLPPDPRN